jgi:hypothetical protein
LPEPANSSVLKNLPTSPALAEVAHFVTTQLPSNCRVTLKGRVVPRLSSAGQGPPPLAASSPAKGEKEFFGGDQTEAACGGAHNHAPKQFCLGPSKGADPWPGLTPLAYR